MSGTRVVEEIAQIGEAIAKELPRLSETGVVLSHEATDAGVAALRARTAAGLQPSHIELRSPATFTEGATLTPGNLMTDLVRSNREIALMPDHVQRATTEVLNSYFQTMAEPLTDSLAQSDVLAHHLGARLIPADQDVTRMALAGHDRYDAKFIATYLGHDSVADLRTAERQVLQGGVENARGFYPRVAERAQQMFEGEPLTLTHLHVADNQALNAIPESARQLTGLGLKHWAKTIANNLTDSPIDQHVIASMLAKRADHHDIASIRNIMDGGEGTTRQRLEGVAYLAKFDYDPVMHRVRLQGRIES